MATAVVSSEGAPRRWRLKLPERLPKLSGNWLTVYSVLWAAALLVAIVAPISATVIDYRGLGHPVWRPHGLVVTTTDRGITVAAVTGDEARRAGVRPGDQVIAIDGWRIGERSRDDRVDKLLDGPEGSVVTLTVRSPPGPERDVRLTSRASTAAQMFRDTGVSPAMFGAAIHFMVLAFPLFLVPAAVLLFIRRRREIIPALLSISFLIISGFVAGQLALTTAGIDERFVGTISVLFGWLPLMLALVTFPDGRLVRKWTAAAILLIVVAEMNVLWWRAGWFGGLIIGLAFVIAGIAMVLRYRSLPAGPGRQQLRWAFLGFFAGISLLIGFSVLQIAGNRLQALDPRWAVWLPTIEGIFAGLSVICMALGLAVSVLHYRLYDADTVIGRSAAYGVLTLGFIALFAGAEKLAELVGERYFEHSIGIAAGAIGAAVAAACIVPLHNRVHRWAERRFQKALIRLREGLPECVADLRESAPVKRLVLAVMSRVEAGARSSREAVILHDRKKWSLAGTRGVTAKAVHKWQRGWTPAAGDRALDCARADPLFPLRVRLCIETGDEPETIGWLLLGPRPDSSFFGKDEREALEHVAGPAARAIHIAQLRHRREEEAEARLRSVEAQVARLARAMTGGNPDPTPA